MAKFPNIYGKFPNITPPEGTTTLGGPNSPLGGRRLGQEMEKR